jgi:hypothetical protein
LWWGAESREDVTNKEVILEHPNIGDHKIGLFYEARVRIKEEEEFATHRVIPDIDFISTEYFDHPNYFRIDGRPILFVYLTRRLEAIKILEDVIKLMKQAARTKQTKLRRGVFARLLCHRRLVFLRT